MSELAGARSPDPPSASPEATEMTPYLWALLGMLVSATVFDAFDIAILSTVAPIIQEQHGLNHAQWGLVNVVVRLGAVSSFFVLTLADRYGRRTIITLTIIGYAVFTGLTATARSIEVFTAYQFCARIFLAAEFALALIIIGEEFPTRWRSIGISLLAGVGALGTIAAFVSARYVLTYYDWRTMYLLGLLPLALVFLVRMGMRETRRFEQLRRIGGMPSLRQQLANLRVPFQPRYRRRSLLVTLIWNCNHMVGTPAVTFWTIHAARDLNYQPREYALVVALGYLFGFLFGAPAAGLMMNRFGRKRSCGLYYLCAAVAIFLLFAAETRDLRVQTVLMSLTIFFFLGASASTNTFATELFPTEIRATGYSWTTNLFGRITEIVTPFAIGLLADRIGIAWAVGVMAVGPVFGGLLVLKFAPETNKKTLEQISAELDGNSVPSDETASAGAVARSH
jgi:putative MFS transporter